MKDLLLQSLVLIVVLVALLVIWRGPDRSIQRGMNYVVEPGQSHPDTIEQDLRQMQALGVQWVAVVVMWYQADRAASEIMPDPQRSLPDETVRSLLRRLRAVGLRAFLRPMVDLHDGRWRGEIVFADEDQRERWFHSYERFLLHYARLAAQEDAALFSVGVELEQMVQHEHSWRELIARVRQIYPGPLTYSANWDSFAQIPFWDALDYVGIDAYFDLDVRPEPTVEELVAAWQPWVRQLQSFAACVRKPILLTEIGVRSIQGASRHPWDWTYEAPLSLQEQANYYEALFRAFWRQPWLAGIYLWAWLPGREGPDDPSYTVAGKPAVSIVKRWYTQQRP